MSDGQEIGRLQAEMKTAVKNVDTLFSSNTKRKEEIVAVDKNTALIGASIEEQSRAMSGVVELIKQVQTSLDKLDEKVDEKFAGISDSLNDQKIETELLRKDFDNFKGKKFTMVRVFQWIGAYGDKNPKLFMLGVMFLFILIWIGVFPESEPFISGVFDKIFDTVKSAK